MREYTNKTGLTSSPPHGRLLLSFDSQKSENCGQVPEVEKNLSPQNMANIAV